MITGCSRNGGERTSSGVGEPHNLLDDARHGDSAAERQLSLTSLNAARPSMEEWRKLALLLCGYGVLKELRPLEPYITTFLNEPPMNFTHNQINLEIYPVSVYSNLFSLVIIFLVTDLLRYKPIIILNSVTGITLYGILLIFRSVFALQIVEVFYGLYMACEVAYYTYIYAKVDKTHYQEVTGYTRAAYLTGRALSGTMAQILLACGVPLMIMAEITLGNIIISSLWAISLPAVDTSIYFHRNTNNSEERLPRNKLKEGFKLLYQDFKAALQEVRIHKYVIWWAACNAGYLQVLQFVQLLWIEITNAKNNEDSSYNGIVEALCTFTGAFGAYSFGRWKANWNFYGELVLGLGALILGGVLVWMSFTESMIVAYITYITFSVIYNAIVTIAKSQIASHVKPDSTGLIFGITIFLALVLETAATAFLVQYWELTAKLQFSMYGYYYIAIGGIYALKWIVERCWYRKDHDNESNQGKIENTADIFG